MELASAEEREQVLALYRAAARPLAALGDCDWSDEYPSMEFVDDDIARGRLYVLRDENALLAAITVNDSDVEDAGIAWDCRAKHPCMLSRLCVAPHLQGKGVAKQVMAFAERNARERGYDSVHLLAAKKNPFAPKIYPAIHYRYCGEIYRYDVDFFCFEKLL